ncbi:MAG: acylneuraminate cytidylyltransferase, partial [Acidobacteriia bacterium]|nr:acylneuraminate cytidylyltransferase [Terriglobia bacterium]
MMRRTVLILQARIKSKRLPGKVLKELLPGRSLLSLTLERLRSVRAADEIVVAIPEGD